MDPKAQRISLAVQSQILHLWGRYEEAVELLARLQNVDPFVLPAAKRRHRAACALNMARIEAECGQVSHAWSRIQEARAVFQDDAKLAFRCDSATCWILAIDGRAEESQRLAAELETRLTVFDSDPGTCRTVLHDLGMAACARGEHQAGISCWTRCLALSPAPVYQPTVYYQRGECHRHLGQLDEARDDYRAAVDMNLDTYHSGLARQRASEIGVS